MPKIIRRRFFTRRSRRSFLKKRRLKRLRQIRPSMLFQHIEFEEVKVNWLKEGF
jgi:hypothetical protein